VVCGQPSYRGSKDAQRRGARERHADVDIVRVWSLSPESRSIPARLTHYGSYFASSLASALSGERPDVCLIMSPPPLLLGVTASVLRLLRGIPFVYSVQDLYPDISISLGVLPADGLLTRVIGGVANACYRAASSLVTLSPGMADKLRRRAGSEAAVHVIP